jgi:hypothetical protein
MADKLDQKETATFEEILMSNVYAQEAVINVLERKGLLSRKEVLEEIVVLRKKSIRRA